MRRSLAFVALLSLSVALPSGRALDRRGGPDLRFAQNVVSAPVVATDRTGGFLAITASEGHGEDPGDFEILAHRYDRTGTAVGRPVKVNTWTRGSQYEPAVCAAGGGQFVALWRSGAEFEPPSQDGSGSAIVGRRIGSNGQPIGQEFLVNTSTEGDQSRPAVACSPAGGFLAAWFSNHSNDSGGGLYVQRFDGAATPVGPETEIDHLEPGLPGWGRVSAAGANGFVVVWNHSVLHILARRLDLGGAPQGEAFQIDGNGHGVAQWEPALAASSAGDFVVAWTEKGLDGCRPPGPGDTCTVAPGPDGSSDGVYAQRYDSAGQAVGSLFQVNGGTLGRQRSPAVAMDAQGFFVVAWTDSSACTQFADVYYSAYCVSETPDRDGSEAGVYAQAFDPEGNRVGRQFRVNRRAEGSQEFPSIATRPRGGHYIVTWLESHPGTGRSFGEARRFSFVEAPAGN